MTPRTAWKRFFQKGDIVGIKVNPVGRKRNSGQVGCISSPQVLLAVVRGLKRADVRPQDIIVFDRYADEFREAGYEELMLEPDLARVRWYASATRYSDTTWATWPYKSLFFATDPVALDHVGWAIIDAKRAQQGWLAVARMGLLNQTPASRTATAMAALAAHELPGSLALLAASQNRVRGQASEAFDRRQPEHVILAADQGRSRGHDG
jgi:hypothetical protein